MAIFVEVRKAVIYSLTLSHRNRQLSLYRKFVTLMLLEKGASSELTDSLVPYGLTVTNPVKVKVLDDLGEKQSRMEIVSHIREGGKLAVICK